MTKQKHTGVLKLAAVIIVVIIAHSEAVSESAPVWTTVSSNNSTVYSFLTLSDSLNRANEALQIECLKDISTYTDINECTAEISSNLNPEVLKGTLAKLTWKMEGATEATSSLSGINRIEHFIFNEGVTFVRYTGTDMAGNSVHCSFTVVVSDNQAPEITAPLNISIKCNDRIPSQHTTLQAFLNAGGSASDNCSLNPVTFKLESEQKSNPTCPYTLIRTYQITDRQGNIGQSKQFILVEKSTEPILSEQEKSSQTLKSGMANTITSNAIVGNWNDGTSWVGGTAPQSGDDVIIVNGATITVDAASVCNDITINGTLNCGGNTLQVNGSWSNNGAFNAGTGTVEFAGTTNASLSGSSSTVFKNFRINKGAVGNILQINKNIQLGGIITLTSGLMQINSGVTVNCTFNTGFTIENNAGIFINGGSFTTGTFSVNNNGLFRIDSGTATIGSSSGNSIVVMSDGTFDIDGGTINIAGRLVVSGGTADISGGTINLNAVGQNSSSMGSLDLSLSSKFNMSAGTINFVNPNGTGNFDVIMLNGTGVSKTFTGGTFNFGDGTTDTYKILSAVSFPAITSTANTNLEYKLFLTSTGTFNFPLADNSGTAIPATVQITGGTFSPGAFIEVKTTVSKYLENKSSTNYLNRYWTVSTSGISSPIYNVTAKYANGDIAGTETGIAMGAWSGSKPWTRYSNANGGANTITANGVTATSVVFAGITSDPPTVDITNGASAAICAGSSVTLTTSATGDFITYSWSPATGLSASNNASPIASPVSTTTYIVTVTDGNGFTATDNIEVNVNPTLKASAEITSPVLTFGDTAQIFITPTGGTPPYTFYFEGKPSNQTGLFTGITGTAEGTEYTWSVNDALNCANASGTITVMQPSDANNLTLKSGMADYTATQSGNWSNPATWGNTGPPASTDNVTIPAGITVAVDVASACQNILINGTLNHIGATTLQVNGNWTNNGSYVGGSGTIEFTGANPATIGGNSTTIFQKFILSKSPGSSVVVVTGNVEVDGDQTTDVVFTSGVLEIGSTGKISFTGNAGFTIGKDAGIFVNGGTLSTGSFSVENEGLIKIDNGTATFGETSGNSLTIRYTGTFDVNGGITNIAGRLVVSGGTADISGGTINLNTEGHQSSSFATLHLTATSVFNMTSGTINFLNPNGTGNLDLAILSGSKTFAGTLNFGTGSTATYRISSLTGFPTFNTALNTNIVYRIPVTSNGTYNFPLTTSNGTPIPASITITGSNYINAYIDVASFEPKHPENDNTTNSLNRYWTVTTSGIADPDYNLTAAYHNNDIVGSMTGFIVGNYSGSAWNKTTNSTVGGGTISISGINQNNLEFTAISEPTVIASATEITICYGTPTLLTASATGDPIVSYSWVPVTGLNNPNIANSEASPTATTTYSVTVTDGNGFTATDDIIITVNPLPTATIAGSITVCPLAVQPDITFTGASGTEPYTFNYNINGGSNQTVTTTSGSSVTVSAPTGTAGTFNYNLVSVSDNNGCSQIQSETATIIVEDITPPTITCPAAVNVNTDAGSCTASGVALGTPVTADNCGVAPVTNDAPATFSIGATTVTWTVTDNSGLTASCTQEVTVTDNQNPTITCPAAVNVNTDAGSCTASGVALGTPVTADNCGVAPVTNDAPATFSIGATTVTWTVTDNSGLTATCTQLVTVTDNQNPTIICPSNITADVDAGICGAIVNYTAPVGTDNCTGATTVRTAGLASGSTFPVGATTNTFVVTDAAGNKASCSFTVTVADNEAPAITCLPAITVNNFPGFCYATAASFTITPPIATDNCNPDPTETPSRSDGLLMNANYPVGSTTITWTASDGTNSSTCTQTITVIDNEAPTFTVPGDITIYTDASCNPNRDPSQTGNPINPKDNCTPLAGLIIVPSDGANVPGSCTGNYSFTRTWTVTDAAGNSTSKNQIITVNDNIRPVISIPPNISITCSDSQDPDDIGWATATDNCSTPIITYSDSIGNPSMSCARNYTIFRNWLAKDLCGNQRSGVQRISVSDTKGPEVVFANQIVNVDCPDDIPGYYENLGEFLASNSLNEVNDLCSGSVTMELYNEFSFFDSNTSDAGYCPESVQRTYRFYDECLNYTDVEQTIFVTDLSACTCTECTEQVKVYNVDLRGNPDGEWILEKESRDKGARCCLDDVWWEEGGKDPYRCVSFNVIIDDGAIGVQIETSKGQDSKEWRVDCEPVNLEGPGSDIICLPSGEYHLFSHCKQGGDGIDYIIRSVTGLLESDDISTRVNCLQQISTTGDYTGDPVWSALNPLYDKYLDTTDPHNPTFFVPLEDKDDVPATIQFEVCAFFDHYICGINVDGTVCDTITVHVLEAIEIELNIDPSLICEDDPLTLVVDVYPASSYYQWQWFDEPGATGNILSTTNTLNLSPPVPLGWYSVRVSDYDPSGLMCNTSVVDFQVQADNSPASVFSPSDDLYIECNDPAAAQQIQDWLATATAEDDLGNPLDVTNNYNGISHACGTELSVVFSAVDICGNIGTDTAKIIVEDNRDPYITLQPTGGSSDCIAENPYNDDGFTNWLAIRGGAQAEDLCDADLTWTDNRASQSWVIDVVNHSQSITIQFTVTDDCDNSVQTIEATYTLIDDIPPTISCPISGDVNNPDLFEEFVSGDGCTWAPTNVPNPGISDPCGLDRLVYTLSGATVGNSPQTGFNYVSGADLNLGITTVIYTLYDIAGNSATCAILIWTKNIDDPHFQVICPTVTSIVVPAETDVCFAEVTIPGPGIDNFCVEVYSATYQIDSETPVSVTVPAPVTVISTLDALVETFEVGSHTVNWTITDASGNVYQCEQTVEVTDVNSVITCPEDIERPVDPGEDFATLVPTGDPAISGNCASPRLIWKLEPPAAFLSQYFTSELTGSGVYTTDGTFYRGVTKITYSLTDVGGNVLIDIKGNQISCFFTVTIINEPLIECPDSEIFSADENCEYLFDPGIPTLTQGSQPLVWTWTLSNPGNLPSVPAINISGGSSTSNEDPYPDPIVAAALHEYAFQLGVTTITWTATDISGNTATCFHTITVIDDEAPTFDAGNKEFCVENLISATYNVTNDDIEYNPDYPGDEEYYLFRATENSTVLDIDALTFSDNCCASFVPATSNMRWRIDIDGVYNAATSIPGNGQPSTNPVDIRLPGDGINFNYRTHTITYWIKDCNGVESLPVTRNIVITPRPKIVKVP